MKKRRVNKLLGKDNSTVFDFLVKVKPSAKYAAMPAACGGHVDILKYFVEERKIVKSGVRVQRCNVWPTRLPQILSRRGALAFHETSLALVTTNNPSAKTTCSKKGLQNQQTYNTQDLSKDCDEENSYDATD